MTEREMWRTVAEAFSTPWSGRTVEQRDLTDYGLCRAIAGLDLGADDGFAWYLAISKLGVALGCKPHDHWWGTRMLSKAHDGERALFAGFLAAMTDRERAQLWEGL